MVQLAPPPFPPDFLFGVASAAYQIEGALSDDGRVPSHWDVFARAAGGGMAPDHYRRYRDDIALMASLGILSYHFSIAWPRVMTEDRKPNPKGLAFYHRLLDALAAHHIIPMVTLYHWDLPEWLARRGGWVNRDTAGYFTDYAELMLTTYGDRVPLWITHYDPWSASFRGYGWGQHAPGHQDWGEAFSAAHHLLLAHGRVVEGFCGLNLRAQIGVALRFTPVIAETEREEDARAAQRADSFYNRWFLDPLFRRGYPADALKPFDLPRLLDHRHLPEEDLAVIGTPVDFLGINYFGSQRVRHCAENPLTPVSWSLSTAWEEPQLLPDALYRLLTRLSRDYPTIPLYITANGVSDADSIDPTGHIRDGRRQRYLGEHLVQVGRAVQEGVALKGYYVWSFLDGFDWNNGYQKRYGLVYVDYATQERRLKDSALWYRRFLAGEEDA